MTEHPAQLRTEISDSWDRCATTGVSIDLPAAPVTLDDGALRQRRGTHPLRGVRPLVEDVLGQAVRDCGAVLALGDADGHLLWVSGASVALRRAERIGFVAGGNWNERVAGTNAPGTALRLDTPVLVRGREHYVDAVRAWSCAATPIHDPVTASVLGVLDVTGGRQVAVPQTLAMVRAAARMAEAELARLAPARGPGDRAAEFGMDIGGRAAPGRDGHAPDGSTLNGLALNRLGPDGLDTDALRLDALGRTEALLSRATGRSVRLGQRHSEILVVLATHPGGLTGTELADLVYPHPVSPATVRAEVNRLRALLGPEVLESRPYRLRAPLGGDWCTVRSLLTVGDVDGAVRAYRGRLLPRSTSPAVEALADDLEWSLRTAVLDSGRVELMAAWTRTAAGGDDLEMWTAQLHRLPAGSPRRPLAAGQVARLDRELGATTPIRRR
ncbi:helix-turn-helix domain-containing protein [Raineyella sp. LH-20]|uniref:helix-turn-helix domain-containing protein n=1 Tax=Raineyella sp. LH-20 TaxID=3081204 RepID=UPI002952CBFC|nr:GAF domain-containing protein [Raineyella sp. LH-20]WOP18792.1 transcriptional regulator [Raineyella sp. LH-20]